MTDSIFTEAAGRPSSRRQSLALAPAAVALLGVVGGCAQEAPAPPVATPTANEARDTRFKAILTEHALATIGAGLIRNGELVWTGYYGEQSDSTPATAGTMFNVGSITKTVTAELAVRLAEQGVITLDEPMSAHWIDPDLVDDPRHEQLTPRLALTHRTGFPNWRYQDPEFRLRFIADPGTRYGYSGEGMDYLARFLERKTGQPFEELVATHVFAPLGLDSISITRQSWVIERLALPVDETGERQAPWCSNATGDYCLGEGEWSSADELTTTVDDYAQFLIAVMNSAGVSAPLHSDRLTVQSSTADDPILRCRLTPPERCPVRQGYGLGWEIFDFDDLKIVSHGGSDWSERAVTYFDPATRDGIVLFLNGPASRTTDALIDAMLVLDPESRLAAMYRGWVDAYLAGEQGEAGN